MKLIYWKEVLSTAKALILFGMGFHIETMNCVLLCERSKTLLPHLPQTFEAIRIGYKSAGQDCQSFSPPFYYRPLRDL